MTATDTDAETLAELWFQLSEVEDLRPLNRALAVGKRRLEAAREVMRRTPNRYARFQEALARGLASRRARERFECAHALDSFGDAAHREALAALMDDPVPKVRWMAMHALTCHACNDKAALERPLLARIEAAASSDPSPRVRRHAGWSLAAARNT